MRQTLLTIITILTATLIYGQILGDGNITTTFVSLPRLEEIDIQFNADITLDYTASETMTDTDKIWISGNVGDIKVLGKCDEARVNVDGTSVDLSETTVRYADITINGRAKVIVNKVNELDTNLDRNANLILLQQPNKYIGRSKQDVEKSGPEFTPNPNLKYISFKIKNNSWKRNHFVVVGPKKDGNTYSYGFPMMPGFSKSEKWSVGTKIYKEGRLGNRELLITISEKDEGQTVKLF